MSSEEMILETTSDSKWRIKVKYAKQAIKNWDTELPIAIIDAVEGNPTANIIVLDGGNKANGKSLLNALEKRYNVNRNNVIRAKLAYFNLLTIKNGETAIQFADRIIESRLELKDTGIDDSMISKDLNCLSRLNEGLARSPIY